MNEHEPDYFPIFLSGILIGTIATVTLLISFRIEPSSLEDINMEYAEFISIVLTAVTVILAVLAVLIGLLAIWGYSQFERMTKSASAKHLEKMLLNGPFSKNIDETIIKHVSSQLEDGELRKILIDRIDAISITDAAKRAKENTESEDSEFKD